MSNERRIALQLCPFSPYLEAGLEQRFEVIRWFELGSKERQNALINNSLRVFAVATGGHIGCSNDLIADLPSLKIVAINGVGADKVDLEFARSRGVRVRTTPGIPTEDVADLAVGFVISMLRGIPARDAFVRSGEWTKGDPPLSHKVSGRRFGIVGLGSIGSAIALRLRAFGPIAYTGPRRKAVSFTYYSSLEELASKSDVLLVTCSAGAETRRLVDRQIIDALGPAGYLVNVARGSVLDEQALIDALEEDRLAGAALDVFENEPHVADSLRGHPRVLLSPHVASGTVETRRLMADMVLRNLDEAANDAAVSATCS